LCAIQGKRSATLFVIFYRFAAAMRGGAKKLTNAGKKSGL
jgi:hypothetical protein